MNKYTATVAKNLRTLRVYAGRTQRQAAHRASVKPSRLIALENGSLRPKGTDFWTIVEKMAKMYRVSQGFLFVEHE